MRRRAALLFAALCGAPGAAHAADAIDYLYVRANEGGSSGGHAAIRFGEWTFDFQHADGLLEMRRQDSRRFQSVYRTLQNRPIELSRIAVSDDTYALLRSGFQRRFLAQEQRQELSDSIAEDARALEALLAQARGQASGLEIDGAGFFFEDGAAVPLGEPARASRPQSPALQELRARIEARRGRDFLEDRRRESAAAIAALSTASPDVGALGALELGVAPATFSQRYEDALAGLLAVAALESAAPLRADALANGTGREAALSLDGSAAARLREASDALADRLAALAASRRPDWGRALLLGMARLAALERSIESGRLALLDAFPASARSLEVTPRRRAFLPLLEGEAAADLAVARARFLTAAGFDEIGYRDLEEAGNRWLELRAARAGAARLRVDVGPLLPRGRGRLGVLPLPGDSTPLAERLAQARAAGLADRAAREREAGYDLLRRNCVTELFATLDAALAGTAGAGEPDLARFARSESERRLGGYVDPRGVSTFVPFVSSQRVRERYAIAATRHLAGFRERRLAEMAQREGGLRVALRESNVVTATAYRGSDDDGFFLFFTDGAAPPLRPLLGALNLAAGIGRSAWGMLALPFDGGSSLRAGLSGALWSLPELAFSNVRKGSNDWVPPAQRPAAE